MVASLKPIGNSRLGDVRRIGFTSYSSKAMCQTVCQACSFGAQMVFACVSLDVISSFSAIVSLLLANTYKIRLRAVDPVVAGSNPVGLVFPRSPTFCTGRAFFMRFVCHDGMRTRSETSGARVCPAGSTPKAPCKESRWLPRCRACRPAVAARGQGRYPRSDQRRCESRWRGNYAIDWAVRPARSMCAAARPS